MNKRAFSPWSPTTDPLPRPAVFRPTTSRHRPPVGGVAPMRDAPTVPGRYIVKLTGFYGLSVMDYSGPYAEAEMEDDHRAGVSFYVRSKRR